MLSAPEIDIFSSFGPLGRSKVIENVYGGSRVVTKDGQQILECCLSDPRSQNSLQRTLLKMCCSVSEEHGDGTLTTLMITSHIIARLDILAKGTSNSCIQWVLLLKAFEIICSAVEALRFEINKHMIDSQVWQSANGDEFATSTKHTTGFLRGLWGTILQPATNTATASKIEEIINRWIIAGCKHIGVIARRCRLILNNWDEHVIISTTGLSLEDSYFVPQNVVIIEGRCRDFTALRAQKTPSNQIKLDAENKSSTGFQFCLLKSFVPLTAAASITQNVTIQINCLTDLNAVEGINLFTAKDSLNTKQLLNYLKNNNVDALFCADSVSDDLIYSVALTGVVLIDRVPTASLERLSKISNSLLWDSSTDLLNCEEKILPSWGTFTELERVTFGKKSDTYYRIQNVKKLRIKKTLVSLHDSELSDCSSGRSMKNIPPKNIPPKNISPKSISPKKNLRNSSQQFHKIGDSLEVENKLIGSLATSNNKDEKVIVGAEKRGRNGEQGDIEDLEEEEEEEYIMTCQLILQSNSVISSNIYCRLIRRCLTAAIRIADDARRSNSKRHTTSTPPTSSLSFSSFPSTSTASLTPSTSKLNTACEKNSKINENTSDWVPGGGAAEMGWSALWGSVSSILTNHLNSQCNVNSNNMNDCNDNDRRNQNENNVSNNNDNDNFLLESQRKCNTILDEGQLCNKSYQTIIRPIAVKIAHRIISNILSSHGFKYKYEKQILNKKENIIYFKSVRTCLQICTLFSDAYIQVPRTMLYNAQKFHQNGPNVISKKSEIIWKLWRSHYELDERVEEMKDYAGGTGRLGLIVPFRRVMNNLGKDDDYLSSEKPYVFEAFSTVTACCNLFLRIGGSDGVISVKRLQGSERKSRTFVRRAGKSRDDSSDEESDTEENYGFEDDD